MTRLLDNRYRILHSLAEGGFGTTFLAEDTRTPSQRRCVVKQLKPLAADSGLQDVVKQRFTREAAVLEELGHEHRQIPLLYAYFEENNEYYLVQEYIQGETLAQCVDRHGRWSEADVRQLLNQLLPVLAYIHDRGIIHRDIKPENIILRQSDGLPALIDFGAVKEAMNTAAAQAPGQAPLSIVIGTAGFMAPEQSVGRPMFSSDLYALGLTVIYCLTGKLPHVLNSDPATGAIDWQPLASDVSATLVNVVTKAISPTAYERFSTAQAMMQALGAGVSVASPDTLSMQAVSPADNAQIRSVVPQTIAPMTPAGTAVAPVMSLVQSKRTPWLIILAWLAAAAATSGVVLMVMTQSRLPVLPKQIGGQTQQTDGQTKPDGGQTQPELTAAVARSTVDEFYQYLSNQSWDQAKALSAETLADQFDPNFFQQFQRISAENLQVMRQTRDRVELIGQNTYFYDDGTTQLEDRTYMVELVGGQPRIVDSKFVRVVKPRR